MALKATATVSRRPNVNSRGWALLHTSTQNVRLLTLVIESLWPHVRGITLCYTASNVYDEIKEYWQSLDFGFDNSELLTTTTAFVEKFEVDIRTLKVWDQIDFKPLYLIDLRGLLALPGSCQWPDYFSSWQAGNSSGILFKKIPFVRDVSTVAVGFRNLGRYSQWDLAVLRYGMPVKDAGAHPCPWPLRDYSFIDKNLKLTCKIAKYNPEVNVNAMEKLSSPVRSSK